SGLGRDGPGLAIATKVLMCRFLRRGARYGEREPARLETGV
ncbi:PTS mannose/fructose/sorbose transporter subunit IIB, partial [Lacticaseibacillus rhamnosus]|nr:PTS mannose/fructose/sorbose transporter subunit IIB [Lacticaseibacillus rhamnosus]